MQNSKFNFAAVFSLMVLLVFSYITFLGLIYWKKGDLLVPIGLTLGLIAIVTVCILVMCKAKATRWRRIGIIGQVFFGIIILVVLLAAAIPFTNFLRVNQDSKEIEKRIALTCDAGLNLDSTYVDYVNKRLYSYKKNLEVISYGKYSRPSQYNECLKDASGNTDKDKISSLEKSLKNKLMPDSTEIIVKERKEWLKGAKKLNVWNPLTASNIAKVDEAVNGWYENYKQLSSISYKGEEYEEFKYQEFNSQLRKLTDTYSVFKKPSLFSLLMSLLCFFIIMLPYIMTRKDLALAHSNNDDPYE